MPMIPSNQIYGIDESLLAVAATNGDGNTTDVDAMASEYQRRVFEPLLSKYGSNDEKKPVLVDCALLGFGPDGHTCSLFPNHNLVLDYYKDESNSDFNAELLVAGIEDSPKPPPKRITLTLAALNEYTRDVIFVGAGESKSAILKDIFERVNLENVRICSAGGGGNGNEVTEYNVVMNQSTIYPCGMIRPVSESLHYVTDTDATKTVTVGKVGCAML